MRDLQTRPIDIDFSVESGLEDDEFRAVFDSTEMDPSTAVVKAMEEILDSEFTEFEPLNNAIDVEALNRICTKQTREGDRHVTFHYLDHRVTVKSYGVIMVQSLSDEAEQGDDR